VTQANPGIEVDSYYRRVLERDRKRKDKATTLLLGTWRVDPSDSAAIAEFGDVTMEFKDDESLTHSIKADGKTQIISLTYKVNGNTLVTNQLSKPREERTVFEFDQEGRLILDYQGRKTRYVRI